jgi:hypothetical protein
LKDIDTLECNVNQASIQLLENKKQDLENIRNEKIKGKIIRSKVQWIKEGGKPTKCFCGLESNIFTSKIIPKIERNDGKTINKQFDILKETKVFYEELYKFREGNGCKVSDLERDIKAITPEPILYTVFSSDIGLQFLRKCLGLLSFGKHVMIPCF